MEKTLLLKFSIFLFIPLICFALLGCDLQNNDFDIETTNIISELEYGEWSTETVVAVYGTITANVECSRVRIECEAYSYYNEYICSPYVVLNISNGETKSFRLSARVTNDGDLDGKMHITNLTVKVLS